MYVLLMNECIFLISNNILMTMYNPQLIWIVYNLILVDIKCHDYHTYKYMYDKETQKRFIIHFCLLN